MSSVKWEVRLTGGDGGCRPRQLDVGWAPALSHLIEEALHHDNQGEGNCVQTEEDVITVHGVHSIGVFEEKLLLVEGLGEAWG